MDWVERLAPWEQFTSDPAAQKAAEEAAEARMCYAAFKAQLKSVKSLDVKKIEGDGNCLFRAIALVLYGKEEEHEKVRINCCDYMMDKRKDYMDLWGGEEEFTKYVDSRRTPVKGDQGHWGDDIEIRVCEEMIDRPFEIYEVNARTAKDPEVMKTHLADALPEAITTGRVPIRLWCVTREVEEGGQVCVCGGGGSGVWGK